MRRGPLWRKIEETHRPAKYPLPVVVVPCPLTENYRFHRAQLCRTSFGRVTVAVCEEFGVRRDKLLGHRKTPDLVLPRHVAMHLMAELYETSERQIGELFKRDHTCVRLAKRKVAAMPPHLASRVSCLYSQLRTPVAGS